jgi:phage tail sheath gpL-like
MPFTLPTEIVQSDKTPRTAIAFDKNSGVKQQASTARDVLLVGQMITAGTATVSVPYELFRENDSEALFGKGSILDFAAKAAFKAHPFVKLSAVAVADAGVKATGTVVFATTATGSTTFQLRIAGVIVQIDITTGDTVTIIGDALAAAIMANTSLPVTAINAAGTVTLTAKNGGTVGNGIQLRGALASSIGTTATVAAALTAGTGAVVITSALAAVAAQRYHEYAILLDDSVSGIAAKTHIDTQSGAEVGFGCFAHQAVNASLGTNTTLALALNAARGSVVSINGSESWTVAIAAAYAAVLSSEEVATRPLNTLALTGIVPPPKEKRWFRTETRNLLDNGCTPLVVMPGEKVGILRSVISGVKNAAGAFDYSTLDITITRGFDDLRDNVKLMFDTNYPRARWADEDPDGLLPADVATPAKVKQDLIDVCREAQSRGICQQVEALKDQFVVQKVGTHCEFSIPANIVDGMHEKLGSIVLYRRTVTSV